MWQSDACIIFFFIGTLFSLLFRPHPFPFLFSFPFHYRMYHGNKNLLRPKGGLQQGDHQTGKRPGRAPIYSGSRATESTLQAPELRQPPVQCLLRPNERHASRAACTRDMHLEWDSNGAGKYETRADLAHDRRWRCLRIQAMSLKGRSSAYLDDTTDIRFQFYRPYRFWVSGYCTKRRIQRQFW